MKTLYSFLPKNHLFGTFSILAFIFAFSSVLQSQETKDKVVFPSKTIVPNDADLSDPVNFGLFQATPVGDINGDGFGDMVYNVFAGDERTPAIADKIPKSLITLSPNLDSSLILYNKRIYGIGDFNGDSFDDFIDVLSSFIYFGNESGIPNDSLFVGFTSSNYPVKILYSNDINGDGFSDFIIYADNFSGGKYFVYAGPDITPIEFDPYEGQMSFNNDNSSLYSYDYDSDGETELCAFSFPNGVLKVKWFMLNKEDNQMILEHSESIAFKGSKYSTYLRCFSDVNGDNLKDICIVYYEYDTANYPPRYNILAYPGLSEVPYFGLPKTVKVGNPSRMLYHAGDFNNDNADDWYSKTTEDSIVIYYGGADAFISGLQKTQYYTGIDKFLLLKGRSLDNPFLTTDVPVLYYDNDSIADLFFNCWTYDDNLQYDFMGTAIVRGGENPDFTNPVLIGKSGDQMFKSLEYGISTKNIGDYNQDGFDDWGVLARSGCYLEIFFGGEEIDTIPDVKFLLPQKGIVKSYDWTSGDLNGDGWIDIAISNSSDNLVIYSFGFINDRENIYIFYGGPSMQGVFNYLDADVVLDGIDDFYQFGYSLAVVGDYNADGFDDLVCGGIRKTFQREAYVYFGGNEIGPEPDMVLKVSSGQSSSQFAKPVTPCGDINGDNYDDFTLGDPSNGAGQSLVYFGGPNADSIYDVVLANPTTNGIGFGRVTSHNAGDFDGDGYNDILQFNYFKNEFYIYKGDQQFDNIRDITFYDSTFTHLFSTLEFIDRQEETGHSDILTGYKYENKYHLELYQGGGIQSTEPLTFAENIGYSAPSVASGDFNNDGLTEIFVGFPYETTFGWPRGGIVKMYVPANYVYTGNDENISVRNYNGVSVYPNPVTSEMNIKFHLGEPGTVTFTIFDITGKSIMSESGYFAGKGTKTFTINPGIVNDGLYILEIKQKGSVVRKKFVFNKN